MKELTLFPYQVEGVAHLTSPLKYSYLADKPGLGKTIQSLTAAQQLGAKSMLILCPASIVNQWQDHIKSWRSARVVSYDSIAIGNVTEEENNTLKAMKAKLKSLQDSPRPGNPIWANELKDTAKKVGTLSIVIQRKQKAKALRNETRNAGPYDVIIADEAHYLKERGSHRTAYVFHAKYGLIHLATKKGMLLSGTPMLNRPAELYAMLRACYPQALHDCPTFEAFGYKFCDGGWGWNGSTDFSGSTNGDILGKRLEGFMLARGVEVLGDRLPGLTYVDNLIPLNDLNIVIDDDEHVATKRRLTGEAKVDKLVADIKSVSKTVKKLVVFYYHESVRKALQRVFPHAPLIKGGLTSFQKSQEIEKFVRLSSEIMLVQLGAGGVGLDGLQYVCNTGYIAELDWTPALEEQAVGRLRRLGQKEHVTIYRPIGTKQGIDERIDKKNREKSVIISGILDHVTSKTVNVGNIVSSIKEGTRMSDKEVVAELSRIADALEALVGIQGQVEAPAKPAKGGAKDKPKKKSSLTLDEARAQIKAEANSVPTETQVKMAAYKQMVSDWGVSKIDDVAEDELEKFTNAAITTMQKAAEKAAAAGDDDI